MFEKKSNVPLKSTLVLEDGSSFEGIHFGAEKSVSGEVVFNTGMTGYPETLTDPSYRGQILVLTYPLIGNYGVPDNTRDAMTSLLEHFESEEIHISALIIVDYSKQYNHWNAVKSLGDWLKEHNIPAIYDVDTRALTKKLREKGVMLGKLVVHEDIPFDDPNKRNLVSEVSCKQIITYGKGEKKVILVDTGVKYNIIRELLKRNLTVIRVPWDYNFNTIECDGIFLSNGPGDPTQCKETISHIQEAIIKKTPIFGICLGNQLLALAAGAKTYKLKYGHRSQNQPCLEVGTKKCFITAQNHVYTIDAKTIPEGWNEWFVNANDQTNEGIIHESGLFKTIQFHAEATPGPVDTNYLFDEFTKILYQEK